MKNKIIICFLVSLSILCSLNCFADLEENIVPEYNSELLFECDEFEFVTENHNINLWVVEDYEKETMHNDEFVFRRLEGINKIGNLFLIKFTDTIFEFPVRSCNC